MLLHPGLSAHGKLSESRENEIRVQIFVFGSHLLFTNRFSITAVCICSLSVWAAGHLFCSLADLPLSFPWFFVCVSYMNYDLWADTVRLNDLNVSCALNHWSSSFLRENGKESRWTKMFWLMNVVRKVAQIELTVKTMSAWYFGSKYLCSSWHDINKVALWITWCYVNRRQLFMWDL